MSPDIGKPTGPVSAAELSRLQHDRQSAQSRFDRCTIDVHKAEQRLAHSLEEQARASDALDEAVRAEKAAEARPVALRRAV